MVVDTLMGTTRLFNRALNDASEDAEIARGAEACDRLEEEMYASVLLSGFLQLVESPR
jgi:hypothetical protein